jgi:hypothetical protein
MNENYPYLFIDYFNLIMNSLTQNEGTNVGGSVPLSAILIGEKGWHRQEDIRQRPSKLPMSKFAIQTGLFQIGQIQIGK